MNQGFGRDTSPLKALGENPSLPLPASQGSRHSLACGSINSSLHLRHHMASLLCVVFATLSSLRTWRWV